MVAQIRGVLFLVLDKDTLQINGYHLDEDSHKKLGEVITREVKKIFQA